MRALFIGGAHVLPARVLWAWLEQGHEIVEFWHYHQAAKRLWALDRSLGYIRPQWSVSAAIRKFDIPKRSVPRLSKWPAATQAVKALGADVLLSCYHPMIVPAEILDLFDGRAVNWHPTLLPRCRGPMPYLAMAYQESMAQEAGVTMHVMAPGIDDGPIIGQRRAALEDCLDLTRWHLADARAGFDLVQNELQAFLAGRLTPYPQDQSLATYPVIKASDLELSDNCSLARIQWLIKTVGFYADLRVATPGGPVSVSRLRRLKGSPNGAEPKLKRFSIEFDCSDQRISMWRASRFDTLAAFAHRFFDIATMAR